MQWSCDLICHLIRFLFVGVPRLPYSEFRLEYLPTQYTLNGHVPYSRLNAPERVRLALDFPYFLTYEGRVKALRDFGRFLRAGCNSGRTGIHVPTNL
jgi:hypothetical protein